MSTPLPVEDGHLRQKGVHPGATVATPMNELLTALSALLPSSIRREQQGSVNVYSVYTAGAWIPVYQAGPSTGWWLHGERHLEYGLREEAERRGWAWQLASADHHARAQVSDRQYTCSEKGRPPVYNLAAALLGLLEQHA